MAGRARLTTGDAAGDDDVTQKSGFGGSGTRAFGRGRGERQDVGCRVLVTVLPVELTDPGVTEERDGHLTAQARRADPDQPSGKVTVPNRTATTVGYGDAKTATVGIHRTIRTP